MRLKKRRRAASLLLVSLMAFGIGTMEACIGGGGGGGGVCCPAASVQSCAPAIPVCSSTSEYSSSGGGSYAAPFANYPRPYGYSATGCSGSTASCGSQSSYVGVNSYASANSYPSASNVLNYPAAPPTIFSYQNAIAPLVSSYNAPTPYQPQSPPVDAYPGDKNSLPDPAPGPEIESIYDDINQEHPEQQTNSPPPDLPAAEKSQQQQVAQNQVEAVHQMTPQAPEYPAAGDQSVTGYGEKSPAFPPPPPPQPPLAQTPYDGNEAPSPSETNNPQIPSTDGASPPAPATEEYTGNDNDVQSAPVGASDQTALNCEDNELRQIVESALQSSADNLAAARKIESDAAARFGGRFNSIVSSSEFAYVNWYGKRNCQLRVNNRHSLTWED